MALKRQNHLVVSHWLDLPDGLSNFGHSPKAMRQYAMDDVADLENCDMLVMFCDNLIHSEGKRVEWGYVAARTPEEVVLVGVGSQTHVFDFLADQWFPNVAALLDWTSSLR